MTDRKSDWPWRVAFLCAGSAVALAWPEAVKLLAAVAVGIFVLVFAVALVAIQAYLLWGLAGAYYRATLAAIYGEYAKGLAVWLFLAIAVRGFWTSLGDAHWLTYAALIVSIWIAISLGDKGDILRTERRNQG